MPTLGTDSSGYTVHRAYAINDAGLAVGHGTDYLEFGIAPIRWSADQIPTRLKSLATFFDMPDSVAYAVNGNGTAVGFSTKNDRWRAARWDGSGSTVTELQNLGTSSSGSTESLAWAINDSNIALGWAEKYESGVKTGISVVRWDASGNATELGNLGTFTSASLTPSAINNAGVAVGIQVKYVEGVNLGTRGVRWNPNTTQAMELTNLGVNSVGYSNTRALALNQSSIIAGDAEEYDSSGNLLGTRAVVWRADGTAIVLNNQIDPSSGWVNLTTALGVSNGNWVMGVGTFDADGAGSLEPYKRAFLLHVDLYTPGDANGDGAVDSVDFSTLASTFGKLESATWQMGDFDGDEKVTTSDFNRLAGHFGVPMTGTIVPEPASLALALVLFGYRRHRIVPRGN